MTISIAERTLSLNIYRKLHWSQKTKLRNRYQLLLRSLYNKQHTVKMHITLTRSYRGVELDEDNLIGGAKPLLDSMTRNGIIVDDNKKWVKIEYKQEKSSIPYTIIDIKEFI